MSDTESINGLDFSKMTVEELNNAALDSENCDKIIELCELGANNYEDIFDSYELAVKPSVYILNKCYIRGLDRFRPEVIDVYLKAGAGHMLVYYPEFLKLPAAQPYLKRHADITEQLAKKLIPDICILVIEYLSYEIPIISDAEMDELEKIYEDATTYKPAPRPDPEPADPNETTIERMFRMLRISAKITSLVERMNSNHR